MGFYVMESITTDRCPSTYRREQQQVIFDISALRRRRRTEKEGTINYKLEARQK